MKHHISKLNSIMLKEERIIVGLMSGTSLDGLDIALCKFRNSGFETQVDLLEFTTMSFSDRLKDILGEIFAQKIGDIELLTLMNVRLGRLFGKMVNEALAKWNVKNENVDVIASHGQTIHHAPLHQHSRSDFGNATLQIADGDILASKTNIITISDFRMKNIAAGGEGAPLSAFGDLLLFTHPEENRILLNIGGISNYTYLPSFKNDQETMYSTDVGPGNTLIDFYTTKFYPPKRYDEGGRIAASGQVNEALLNALLDDQFFRSSIPKSSGQEYFNLDFVDQKLRQLSCDKINPNDLLATLTRFTTKSIQQTINRYHNDPIDVYVSGGGVHNQFLFDQLRSSLGNKRIEISETLGINSDAKEAILFALLANETLVGQKSDKFSRYLPFQSFGKISFPLY